MICPLKNHAKLVSTVMVPLDNCTEVTCAWWNATFGMCCMAVAAYTRGQEEEQAERRAKREAWDSDRR